MRTVPRRKPDSRKWSADVTENSNALDLDEDVFKSDNPAEIARSLKKSAERSAEVFPVPCSYVGADVLHQPSRQKFEHPTKE